ncbi:fimbrial protein [Erwinia tasmaniensis]|uniref:MrfH protein n=1 Tax=Erwinia tasmaniensis (strain DSM 17950 / CFBP 7177 / CIP 109463 / NCPPB 4357 / Et1/99) TaxID=465817 RepID=B2VGZ2_ERWT9|nr:fimbrial protein [Erwinia tasmaniensis]CAO95312.1 MrfH protein [Erwinia tasmaniensis Et1/99]
MLMKNPGSGLMLILMLAGGLNVAQAASAPSVNISYDGNLVADPCTLLPEDESIVLDFGSVIDKYLYLNTRTHGKLFQLHLMDCDISLGNSLKITFRGTESIALPGLLAPDGGSEGSGIAIGLETHKGEALALNQPGSAQDITNGSNVIALKAYIKGEPEAIKDKKIRIGAFSAVATFHLEYE